MPPTINLDHVGDGGGVGEGEGGSGKGRIGEGHGNQDGIGEGAGAGAGGDENAVSEGHDENGGQWDMNYIPHGAQNKRIEAAISNSFGFGGTCASLCMVRYVPGGRKGLL